jgi:uncharacterized membrane protein
MKNYEIEFAESISAIRGIMTGLVMVIPFWATVAVIAHTLYF